MEATEYNKEALPQNADQAHGLNMTEADELKSCLRTFTTGHAKVKAKNLFKVGASRLEAWRMMTAAYDPNNIYANMDELQFVMNPGRRGKLENDPQLYS